MTPRYVLVLVAVALALTACRSEPAPEPATPPAPTVVVAAPRQLNPATSPVTRPPVARDDLAKLTIDDRPYTGPPYRREDWPHWKDPDRNGCDARRDALRSQSLPPITATGCTTTGGHWSLVYVPGETRNAGDVDVDHVVPLGNAARSGGGVWTTDQRARYANDPAVLWVVDDGANQAKGDRAPDAWRPAVRAVWCTYAARWLWIKVAYRLTATTRERDALGEMLDTCER